MQAVFGLQLLTLSPILRSIKFGLEQPSNSNKIIEQRYNFFIVQFTKLVSKGAFLKLGYSIFSRQVQFDCSSLSSIEIPKD
jgi:hypothetical protein